MTDIQFYHLTSTPLERALPKLLEKTLQAGFTARVKFASEEKVEWMNTLLWTYNPDSFLPHGSAKDGCEQSQPIYLTATDEDPNTASLLIITDGSQVAPGDTIKRLLDIFDGTDETSVIRARERFASYRSQGHGVSYLRQTASGGWEKPSES